MIGGFYKKHHGLNEEGVAPSGSGRSVNFISKYKVLSKRKTISFAEHLAVWEEVEVHQGRQWVSGGP